MRLPHLELMSPAALKALSITALIPSGVRDGVFILLSIGVLISPQARAVSIVEPPTHFVARGGIDSCPVSHAGQGIEFYDVATAGVFPDVQRSTTPLLRDSRLPADPMHAPPLFDNRPCIGGDHGVILGTVPDGDCWPRSLVIRSVAEFRSQGLTIRQTVPSHAIEGLRDCRRRLIRQA